MKKDKICLFIILLIAIAMIITGVLILCSAESFTGLDGVGTTRASTSIEFGADFYTSSARYTGLAANAVIELFRLVRLVSGMAFLLSGLLVAAIDVLKIMATLKNAIVDTKEEMNTVEVEEMNSSIN